MYIHIYIYICTIIITTTTIIIPTQGPASHPTKPTVPTVLNLLYVILFQFCFLRIRSPCLWPLDRNAHWFKVDAVPLQLPKSSKVIQSHPKSSDQQIALGKIYRIDQLTMVKWPAFWRYPKRSKESHGTCISAVCISAARCSSWRIPSSTCEIQKWPQLSLNVSKYLVNIIKYLVIDITKWFSSVPFKAVGPGFFTFDTQSHGDICYSRCQWIWLQE